MVFAHLSACNYFLPILSPGKPNLETTHRLWSHYDGCTCLSIQPRLPVLMERNDGVYNSLNFGWIYNMVQNIVGSKQAKKWLVRNLWKCKVGEKVVDMGCGTGDDFVYLPENVDYYGFDISEEYIKLARNRNHPKARFLVGTAEEFTNQSDCVLQDADLVLCTGLLHHLDDNEAIKLLQLAKRIMKPMGRLCCFEPTFLIHQGWFSKYVTNLDRGQNIRDEQGWRDLFGRVFSSFSCEVATGLIRIPYHHVVVRCERSD